MTKPDFPPLNPKVVLGVAAHPDDLDFAAAGTMALFASQGAAVHYLILTDGGKGSHDRKVTPAEVVRTRQAEQRAAADAIGAKDVQFLAYPDSCLEVTQQLKKDIVKTIRTLKPDVVIAMDPSMFYSAERGFINHPDHRAAGQATLDAVFPLARDYLSFPELDEQGHKPHEVTTVLLTNFDRNEYCVDITSTIDKKMAAIAAHASQFSDLPAIKQYMKERAHTFGQKVGCEYAECFVRIDVQP
ncbi:MAG TPA: PIG-L deacetylase family protein [Patescibacteria group bacterium]|nr:PIG-L deacetylase family protein [Patescibacteria group bacterium]